MVADPKYEKSNALLFLKEPGYHMHITITFSCEYTRYCNHRKHQHFEEYLETVLCLYLVAMYE